MDVSNTRLDRLQASWVQHFNHGKGTSDLTLKQKQRSEIKKAFIEQLLYNKPFTSITSFSSFSHPLMDEKAEFQRGKGTGQDHTARTRQSWNANPSLQFVAGTHPHLSAIFTPRSADLSLLRATVRDQFGCSGERGPPSFSQRSPPFLHFTYDASWSHPKHTVLVGTKKNEKPWYRAMPLPQSRPGGPVSSLNFTTNLQRDPSPSLLPSILTQEMLDDRWWNPTVLLNFPERTRLSKELIQWMKMPGPPWVKF